MKILKSFRNTVKAENLLPWSLVATMAISALGVFLLQGCSTFGRNPSPPVKAESLIYQTQTNYVPVVVPAYTTNQVQVTSFQTNVQGVTVTKYETNVVPVTVPATTNLEPAYINTVKPSVQSGIQGAGGILNTFFPGIGSIALNALLALLGAWGYLRSSKLGDTSAALTQEIQVVRQILQSVPNGAALDNAFVQWIQNHQADAGVLKQVMDLIASEVSNKDAQTAAQQIAATVAALTSATTPPKV